MTRLVMVMFCVALDGLDFYYQQQQDARKLIEFLQSVVPCRYVCVLMFVRTLPSVSHVSTLFSSFTDHAVVRHCQMMFLCEI